MNLAQVEPRPAILHIGPGAFHRTHQALYAQALIRAGHPEAGIRAICLMPPHLAQVHQRQGGRYHVLLRDDETETLHEISAIREMVDGPSPDMFCDPALTLVTMTLTEKGYCHQPGSSRLDPAVIAADLADPSRPVTAIGWIALALDRRRLRGLPGLTLASCDNIAENGHLLRSVLSDYAARVWPELAEWMASAVTFPVSMVDRIVPRVDDETTAAIMALAGQEDALGTSGEPFGQWVIEHRFARPIPPLDTVGVQYVADVAPYEAMKHRILNGAQTANAHLGALSGFQTTADSARDPVMARWLTRFVTAQAQTLTCPPGEDLGRYCKTTLQRLRNPHIRHPLQQIGTDSSFKLRQRVVEATVFHLDRPETVDLYALTLAAWMRYNTGQDAQGRAIRVDDPLAGRFAQIVARAGGQAAPLVDGFLELDLFAGPIRDHAAFRQRLVADCEALSHVSPVQLLALREETAAAGMGSGRGGENRNV